MTKVWPSRLRPLGFWFMSITRSPAQKPAHKDLGRNDQSVTITLKAAYVLFYAHNALPGAGTCM
ncbi:Malolactic regulator [Lacticaseibacillus rhamnosus]|nr:Malolactic regulator [Lacticaseibacillus rhamnosus]MCT3178028.1 Malolactic regulator [Lacticaseibacillus rhamnosus]MCT3182670.1 Malolactic regulator [Lacticaseibacillus rhamnosus]MCT4449149.1 Malolactic regulator [Lacticaseibacillus rhamnosus]